MAPGLATAPPQPHSSSKDEFSEILSPFLSFNSHFPGEPGLAGVYWRKGWWRWWWQLDYWSCKSCKAPVKSSPPTNQHPVFTGRMPFLSPNQQCQSTEGKNITFHGLAYPKLTWGLPTLSLTTNSSSLSWGMVAMPLLSQYPKFSEIAGAKFVAGQMSFLSPNQ